MKPEFKEQYWIGGKNRAIRYYFYCQRGLALINEFRYLIITILGTYAILKLTNPMWLVVMFCVSIPIIIIIGYYNVHHMSVRIDWLNIFFGTHYSRRQFEIMEEQLETLKEILKK